MEMEFYHYKAGSIWRVIAPGCCSVKHFFRKTVPVYFALTPFSFMKGLIISWSLNLPNQVLIVCFSDKHCMCPAKGSFCTNGEIVGSQFCSWSFHKPDSYGQTGRICSQQPLLWLPSQALSQVNPSSSLRNSSSSAFLASAPDSASVSVWPLGTGHLHSCLSVQFSHSVISNSLWPHGLQHTRLPCSSPTPGACLKSCPSNWWCHPTIWSCIIPFFCLQSFQASGSFPTSQFFASGGQNIGVSVSASVL